MKTSSYRAFGAAALFLSTAKIAPVAAAQAVPSFTAPDPALDRLVDECLETEGVNILNDSDVICYNAAIFPEQFLQLADMPPASKIIITSPGGNVATARIMSGNPSL